MLFQTWISNYRKKLARPRKDIRPKSKKRKLTGYDIYTRACMAVDGKNYIMKHMFHFNLPVAQVCSECGSVYAFYILFDVWKCDVFLCFDVVVYLIIIIIIYL